MDIEKGGGYVKERMEAAPVIGSGHGPMGVPGR